jgi:DNA polymerase III delta prime subunit
MTSSPPHLAGFLSERGRRIRVQFIHGLTPVVFLKSVIMAVAMHAFLFVGGSTATRKIKTREFAQKRSQKIFEFTLTKISDVRELAGFTKFSENSPTVILINDIENATTEALNAFLKNLEEPRDNLIYILNARSEQTLIQTIISRCQVIRVPDEIDRADGKKAINFMKMSVGEKFKLFESLRKRDDALNFMEELVLNTHKEMINAHENLPDILRLMKDSQSVINNLNLNANIGLQLTNLAIKTKADQV